MCSLHFSIFFCSVFLHISNFYGDKGTIFFEYYKIFVFNSADCKMEVAKRGPQIKPGASFQRNGRSGIRRERSLIQINHLFVKKTGTQNKRLLYFGKSGGTCRLRGPQKSLICWGAFNDAGHQSLRPCYRTRRYRRAACRVKPVLCMLTSLSLSYPSKRWFLY